MKRKPDLFHAVLALAVSVWARMRGDRLTADEMVGYARYFAGA